MVDFYNVYTINCHIFEDLKQFSRQARHIKFARHKSTLVAHQAYVSALCWRRRARIRVRT